MPLTEVLSYEELVRVTNGSIEYSNKELFEKLDGRFDQLTKKIDDQYAAQTSEIRDVRHRVSALESASMLRAEMDKRLIDHFDDYRGRLAGVEERIEPIEDYVTGRRDIDNYRKWLIGTGLVIVGLLVTIVAVVISRGG